MIRPATASDLDLIIALIRELADYENAADQVDLDRDRFRRQVFDDNAAAALLAFDDATGEPVGLALYFFNFSTWTGGRGLYLEDLFVRPAYRGKGHGTAFFRELANIAWRTTAGGWSGACWTGTSRPRAFTARWARRPSTSGPSTASPANRCGGWRTS